MAHFTRVLTDDGPIVDAVFHISLQRLVFLNERGFDRPRPVRGRALIDTGASCSCVDPSVTRDLGLESRGWQDLVTPSTGETDLHSAAEYDVSIIIPPGNPGDERLIIPTLPVVHSELLVRQGIHALIGRDVLARCIVNYNGSGIGGVGYFSLAW